MNRWTTHYHAGIAQGKNHEDAKHAADHLYNLDLEHDAKVAAGEPEYFDYDFTAENYFSDECMCGRGDGCDCDGMEEKARGDMEESRNA